LSSKNIHTEILTANQAELLPLIKKFSQTYYLVGGTAVALHIGHRRSVDFDLFTPGEINRLKIKSRLMQFPFKQKIIFEDQDQLHFIINQTKITFFSYPYDISHSIDVDSIITIPSLLSLAAMKAFALGRRAKWKDYVDLYFILRDYYTIKEISTEAVKFFSEQFSEKLFREQLAFHKDIDYTESVEYLGVPADEPEIKKFLIDKATDIF